MYVKRKPEPLGVEFKTIGDAQSGVLLNMEITKGKAELIKPKFWTRENGATAATTLRLSEPWFGTQRVTAGDVCSMTVSPKYFLLPILLSPVPPPPPSPASAHQTPSWAQSA